MANIMNFPTERSAKEAPDFAQVYEENYDRIYKYTYSILLNKEDTEDVVEDTFITAFAAYSSYDPERASVATWLTRIAHNRAVNLVRSAAYRKRAVLPEYVETEDKSADDVSVSEDREMVMYLYSKLKTDEREFLNMRYAMGLTDSEVAQMLGMTTAAVNKRYQRLLAKCRDLLSE